MNEKTPTSIQIEISDFHNVGDKSNKEGMRTNVGPAGFVEIYELDEDKNKKLIGKSNLVTYLGREWLLTRALNYENPSTPTKKNEFIAWFGLGMGGVVETDPFDPIPPTNLDTDLVSPIMINATDTSCGDLRSVPIAGYYKHPFDSIEFVEDNENSDKFLVAKITITIGYEDANNQLLSEAGLFTATSGTGGYSGNFHLYARVTFPAVYKHESRNLTFVWYLYM